MLAARMPARPRDRPSAPRRSQLRCR
jgi:hypothetical protein